MVRRGQRHPKDSKDLLMSPAVNASAEIPEETMRTKCGTVEIKLKAVVKYKGNFVAISFVDYPFNMTHLQSSWTEKLRSL